MVRNWQQGLGQLGIIAIAIGFGASHPSSKLLAQITPDQTLGAESSLVNSDVINGLPSDRISGGAIRGSNLFHSFQEFNIGEGRGAYFSNPTAIENIFSRVTGSNPSHLLGTLGVLGNANLFFLNPNGLIFGSNARLDVRGSFVGSTASKIVFPDGTQFSATNPEGAPLLTVNVQQPIGLRFEGQEGLITNAADLAVGQNLTLAGSNLDLQGQLQAGGDLTLQATDTVKVRDSIEQPFIASASGKLVLQGNQWVDIFAFNHPDSGFFSGGDMVLRSGNSVIGDAHYWSRGNFRIEQLDGSLGDFFSFYDPIIRSQGDVSFNTYLGTSLHILAGGSVNIGSVFIIESAPAVQTKTINPTATPTLANVTLSDGTPVVINGSKRATLDVRAGMKPQAIGSPGDETSGIFFDPFPSPVSPPVNNPVATSADITIGNVGILAPNGLVFITNQYQPNQSLPGGEITIDSINAIGDPLFVNNLGDVIFDSRGSITLNSRINVSASRIDSGTFIGNGGDVTLLANGNITFNPGSEIFSRGLIGGNITIRSDATISVKGSDIQNPSFSNTVTNSTPTGGNIQITAKSISVTDGASLATPTFGEANAGSVTIQAQSTAMISDSNILLATKGNGNAGDLTITAPSVELIGSESSLSSEVVSEAAGNGGNITIDTKRLLVRDGAFVSTSTFGSGNGGELSVTAQSVELIGSESSLSAFAGSGKTPARGNGGNITIDTEHLLVRDGAFISTSPFGSGKGGDVTITAQSVELIGGILSSGPGLSGEVSTSGTRGNGGDITIDTERLLVRDGGVVLTTTFGSGKAGNLTIKAQSIKLTGISADGEISSALSTQVDQGARGDGGELSIETGYLRITDGAVVSAATLGSGKAGELTIKANILELDQGGQLVTLTTSNFDAGNINLKVEDSIMLSGTNSGIFANTEEGSSGKGGSILIDPQIVIIRDGAKLNVDSLGTGEGGNIFLQTGSLTLDEGTISAETASNTGGNIELQVQDLLLLRNGSNISTNAGTVQGGGDGGNIIIDSNFILAFPSENSDITANAVTGDGGRVEITANGILGIEPRMKLTPLSDITASSTFGVAGIVEINTPDIDPNRGLTNLPEEAVEVEVASGCQAEDGQTKVGFFNLGRGGIPPSPYDPLRSERIITPWIPLISQKDQKQEQAKSEQYPIEHTVRLGKTPCPKK